MRDVHMSPSLIFSQRPFPLFDFSPTHGPPILTDKQVLAHPKVKVWSQNLKDLNT
jgi:hypothetical protein